MTAATATQVKVSHVLPGWFQWVQRNVSLAGLLVAQFLITGAMILQVSVSDPANWQNWTWLNWVNAAVAVLLASAAAGIALGLSENMAQAFTAGKWLTGFVTFLGMMLLVSFDIWSGIAERSTEAHATPADNLLVAWTGMTAFAVVTPTVILIAVLHSALLLFFGWSNRPQVVETDEERTARHRREEAEASHKRVMRQGSLLAMVDTAKAARETWTGKKPVDDAATSTEIMTGEGEATLTSEDDGPTPANVLTFAPAKPSGKRRANQWTYVQLRDHVEDTYHIRLTDEQAKKHVTLAAGKEQKLQGVTGNPYWVNKATAIKYCANEFTKEKWKALAN